MFSKLTQLSLPTVPGQRWDLIVTMDDATNEQYSMFFVGQEGTASSCWQQIELSGFVVNELSALVAAKNSVEGAARNRIFSRRRLRRTYAAAFKLDASPFPVLS